MDAPTRYEFMHQAGAVKSEDGRFVLYSEYARIVAEKEARIADLERLLVKAEIFLSCSATANPLEQIRAALKGDDNG